MTCKYKTYNIFDRLSTALAYKYKTCDIFYSPALTCKYKKHDIFDSTALTCEYMTKGIVFFNANKTHNVLYCINKTYMHDVFDSTTLTCKHKTGFDFHTGTLDFKFFLIKN